VVAVGPQADRPGALVGRPRRRPDSWPEPLAVDRLVVCVDGSDASEQVLPIAAGWASALDMRLSIVTVAEDAALDTSGARPNRFGPPDPQAYVDGLAARWGTVVTGTSGQVVFDPISPAAGLDRHLADDPAGLVALATPTRSGLERIRLGATAADIVAASTVPVLVCPVAAG
jgi:nucleotide-binding universal stress UspA family protein